jgi:hypothetical protein
MSSDDQGSPAGLSVSRRPATAVVLAVGALLVLLVVARPLALAGIEEREELLSSNTSVLTSDSARIVRRGKSTCQDRVYLPGGAARIRLYPGFRGTGTTRLRLSVGARGRVGQRTTVDDVASGQPLTLALDDPARTTDAVVCIRNIGRRDVSIAEARGAFGGEQEAPIRIDVLGAGARDTVTMVPSAVERAGRLKSTLVGRGTLVLGAVAVLAVTVLLGLIVLRSREEVRS